MKKKNNNEKNIIKYTYSKNFKYSEKKFFNLKF